MGQRLDPGRLTATALSAASTERTLRWDMGRALCENSQGERLHEPQKRKRKHTPPVTLIARNCPGRFGFAAASKVTSVPTCSALPSLMVLL